ncbi:hypothetical protein [Actinomyces faecalis]|uniref:hypothetical protein n=1 Tax=Actinomyces faecalis TaxID=2722820 RepID=UPI0015558EAE|nr:hypothetical protein [Actinomyces faecalis]
MSEQTTNEPQQSQGCGCGGHGRREEVGAPAPEAVQPLGEGYQGDGVVPGRKAGNVLGLRDVSAAAAGGGCGCGGRGHGGGRGGCGCGGH